MAKAKMTTQIKRLVSKNKLRYKDNEFDLDLSYIDKDLIAMGFPAEKLEGLYRNQIDKVAEFLKLHHADHFKVYNLCSERRYDSSKFDDRVATFAFPDHLPPSVEQLAPFCDDVDRWLAAHPDNVAAIHCKAGKGRTGVMICCYMLHRGQFSTAREALQHYAQKRTNDCQGVTIPSQRRYVEYYERVLRSNVSYTPTILWLRAVRLHTLPIYSGAGSLVFTVCHGGKKVYREAPWDPRKQHHNSGGSGGAGNNNNNNNSSSGGSVISTSSGGGSPGGSATATGFHRQLTQPVRLVGDCRVELHLTWPLVKKEKLCGASFNTFFVSRDEVCVDDDCDPANGHLTLANFAGAAGDAIRYTVTRTLTICKSELDKAYKDKSCHRFTDDFKLSLYFTEDQILEVDKPASNGNAVALQPQQQPMSTTTTTSSNGQSVTADDVLPSPSSSNGITLPTPTGIMATAPPPLLSSSSTAALSPPPPSSPSSAQSSSDLLPPPSAAAAVMIQQQQSSSSLVGEEGGLTSTTTTITVAPSTSDCSDPSESGDDDDDDVDDDDDHPDDVDLEGTALSFIPDTHL